MKVKVGWPVRAATSMELIDVFLDNHKIISFRRELLLKDPRADVFLLTFVDFLYKNRTKSVKLAIVTFLDGIGYNWMTYLVLEPDLPEKLITESSLVVRFKTAQKQMEADILYMEKMETKEDKVDMLMSWAERAYIFLRE